MITTVLALIGALVLLPMAILLGYLFVTRVLPALLFIGALFLWPAQTGAVALAVLGLFLVAAAVEEARKRWKAFRAR